MRFLLLMLLILICGCDRHSNNKLNEKENLANEITKKVAIKLQKEQDLHPCGFGGRAMNQIGMLALSFDYYHDITIASGRELLVSTVKEFIETINRDERIRPYLQNYPFESENVQIRIFLRNPDGTNPSPGNFCWIVAIDGNLSYHIENQKNEMSITVHEETYEEALLKVQNKSN